MNKKQPESPRRDSYYYGPRTGGRGPENIRAFLASGQMVWIFWNIINHRLNSGSSDIAGENV